MPLAAFMLNKVRISVCFLFSLKHDELKQVLFASNIIPCIEKAKIADESMKKCKRKKKGSELNQQHQQT